MAFQGFLIKVGDVDITKYIVVNTYQITPDSRTELDTYRNGGNELIREVAEHTTTKIEFNTVFMNSDEMTEFCQILEKNYIIPIERKCIVTYFNVINGTYKSSYMYVPNFIPKLLYWDGKTLMYDQMRIAFMEY